MRFCPSCRGRLQTTPEFPEGELHKRCTACALVTDLRGYAYLREDTAFTQVYQLWLSTTGLDGRATLYTALAVGIVLLGLMLYLVLTLGWVAAAAVLGVFAVAVFIGGPALEKRQNPEQRRIEIAQKWVSVQGERHAFSELRQRAPEEPSIRRIPLEHEVVVVHAWPEAIRVRLDEAYAQYLRGQDEAPETAEDIARLATLRETS